VNTVGFNAGGDTLISGSDDQKVMLWDWDTGAVKMQFHSGHGDNVFQARFMPYTDDRTIVTCAADGQVHVSCSRSIRVSFSRHFRGYNLSMQSGESCQGPG
jgi:WD repeat-containing protein 42A